MCTLVHFDFQLHQLQSCRFQRGYCCLQHRLQRRGVIRCKPSLQVKNKFEYKLDFISRKDRPFAKHMAAKNRRCQHIP